MRCTGQSTVLVTYRLVCIMGPPPAWRRGKMSESFQHGRSIGPR